MSTITALDDRSIYFYRLSQDISLVVSTILVLSTLIIISTISTDVLGRYRWYIFNEVLGSYAFDLVVMVLQPIGLLPAQCCYSIGFVGIQNPEVTRILLKLIAFGGVWKGWALLLALVYR